MKTNWTLQIILLIVGIVFVAAFNNTVSLVGSALCYLSAGIGIGNIVNMGETP